MYLSRIDHSGCEGWIWDSFTAVALTGEGAGSGTWNQPLEPGAGTDQSNTTPLHSADTLYTHNSGAVENFRVSKLTGGSGGRFVICILYTSDK